MDNNELKNETNTTNESANNVEPTQTSSSINEVKEEINNSIVKEQNMNNQVPNNEKPKSNNLLVIILAVLLVAALGYIGITMVYGPAKTGQDTSDTAKDNNKNNTSSESNNSSEDNNKTDETNKENIETTPAKELTADEIKDEVIRKTYILFGAGEDISKNMGMITDSGFKPQGGLLPEYLDVTASYKLHTILNMNYPNGFNKIISNDIEKVSPLVGKVLSGGSDANSWVGKYDIIDGNIIEKSYKDFFGKELEKSEEIDGCPRYYYSESTNVYLADTTSCGPNSKYILYYNEGYEVSGDKYIVKMRFAVYTPHDENKIYAGLDTNSKRELYSKALEFNQTTHNYEYETEIKENYSKYWPYEFVYSKNSNGYYVLEYITAK